MLKMIILDLPVQVGNRQHIFIPHKYVTKSRHPTGGPLFVEHKHPLAVEL